MTRLVCLPFAGAGPSFYRAWAGMVDGLEVEPVPLPGRERLIDVVPYGDLHVAADSVSADMTGPIVLFGHSVGGVLAYEIARRLGPEVLHLVVSGTPPPGGRRAPRVSGLPDDEFLAEVERLTGYRHPAFDHPEMRDLLLPALRADFQMDEDYVPSPGGHVDVPITVVRGADDELAGAADVDAWRTFTTCGCDVAEMPGGHMYLAQDPGPLLRLIVETVHEGRMTC
ncbi:thioesterase II family protein [Kutzneria sp. 744]|uniref:thioesterase II family protein n=1 Tax=Kutzneria sp. (strain 744) TaxID=345341 RepID=UPI0003EEDF72|nr:alpha/beta fold hydrolase [Kutzneria sp. 744]EWM13734.1 thioesterase [Kutzneria sp. 744]